LEQNNILIFLISLIQIGSSLLDDHEKSYGDDSILDKIKEAFSIKDQPQTFSFF